MKKKFKFKYQDGGSPQGEQPSTLLSGNPQIAKAYGKDVLQFDSNKAKKNPDGTLTVKDYSTNKTYKVKRNSNGSYDMVNPNEYILSMYQGNAPGNFNQQDSAYLKQFINERVEKSIESAKGEVKKEGKTIKGKINKPQLRFLGREINPEYVLEKEMPRPSGAGDYMWSDNQYSKFDTVGDYGQGLYLLKSKEDDKFYKFIKPNSERPAKFLSANVERVLNPFKEEYVDLTTGNPSKGYGRQEYQQGGTVNPNQILASFLETLPEEEQDQFVDEFQELTPEEQLEVIQAISQQMSQTQQPQMQSESLQEYEEGGSPKNGDTKRATQKGKKMAVYMDGKWHNFGDSSMDDYRTHKSEKRKDAFYSRHKKNLQGDDARSKAFRVYARKTWQEGGQTPGVEIEVEGDETVKLPNGELQRFEGPKHSEGGIPTVLPEGAKIYSEHLKAPPEVVEVVLGKKTKKKYSYADLSKKFPTKPFEDKLQNPNLDKFEKQAAAIKLENHKTMLETIFEAQEMDKARSSKPQQVLEAQQGGRVLSPQEYKRISSEQGYYPEKDYKLQSTEYEGVYYDPKKKQYTKRESNTGMYFPISINEKGEKAPDQLTPQQWSEVGWRPGAKVPDSDVVVKGQPMSKDAKKYVASFVDELGQPNIFPVGKQPSDYPTDANSFDDYNNVIEQIEPIQQPPAKGKPKVKVPSKAQPRTTIDNLAPLPGVPLPSSIPGGRNFADEVLTSSWKWEESGPSDTTKNFAQEDLPADDQSYPGKDPWWKDMGISRQLSGTIFDSLMAASNRLNVDEPQYRDNRKQPLFTRFVDFEDKEVSKQYNLAMQQIMNSNMPEQVKQSQIANLNAKLQDYQGKQDLQRNQLYQQKLYQDTEKLQGYMDRNIDQATADLENYRMKKARIEDLKNQFKAKRKADIINPIRKYLDFVQEVDLQNQVYADNFAMNPWTGKVKFTKSTPDPLKKQEELMKQYPSGSMSRNIDGGGRLISLPGGIMLYEDPSGRTIELTGKSKPQEDDGRAVAEELMNRKL